MNKEEYNYFAKENLLEEERVDEIGFGDLKLIQNWREFCYGVDAVILSQFAAENYKGKEFKIVDLGTGTGIIPLILSFKLPKAKITGVEVQRSSWDRACRNAKGNGLEERIAFLNEDVKDYKKWGKELKGTVDMIVCNPPYFQGGGGLKNKEEPKTIARHETSASLEEFLKCSDFLLKPKGELFMVHRPSRLADLCYHGRELGLEPKRMQFVSPDKMRAPNILLLQFVKGGGKELRLSDPLFVYDEEGKYSPQVLRAYD